MSVETTSSSVNILLEKLGNINAKKIFYSLLVAGILNGTIQESQSVERKEKVEHIDKKPKALNGQKNLNVLPKTNEINIVREIKVKNGKFILGNTLRAEHVDNTPRPIASLTKLLTVLVAYELCQEKGINTKKKKIKLDQSDKKLAHKSLNNKVGIGEYTIDELINMTIIKSTNEAAEGLASGIIPRSEFIRRMNTKAKGIGMIHSKFDSPSGLSQNNVSTPTDLEKLIIAILNSQYPIGRKTENESVKIRGVKGGQVTSANGNTIRKLESQDHEILLTKTGYIRPSGRCEITVIKNPQGKIYSMLLLKAASDGRRKKFTWNTGKALETKT